ncbi:ferric reductase like transmembrane component-domain-containing protein [Sporodiniella umbellata]|nr:ferric reductase like transmembrane component-domain-containing protein [Sporodiniella umbellata]
MDIRTNSNFHVCGISYAFFCWSLFAFYCIGYQINRVRIFYTRKSRIAGQEKVVKAIPGGHLFSWLNYVVRIPFVTEMIPVKHIIGVFLFTVVNALFILFAPFQMLPDTEYFLTRVGIFDRRAAFVGMVNWSFVFFLAQRNSVLPKMSGLTFEELIPFHRWVARIGLLEFIPHFAYRMMRGYQSYYVIADALFYDIEYTTGTVSMLGFLLMFVTSFGFIRRRFFEVFYYSHIIGVVVGIIFGCWHETTCFAYFIPATLLWVFDRAVRSYQSWVVKTTSVRVDEVASTTTSQEGIFRVLFEYSGMTNFRPGQYVFVSMAQKGSKLLGYANWHPFTISEVFRFNKSNDGSIEERVMETSGEKAKGASDANSLSNVSTLRRRANVAGSEVTNTMASIHIKALGNYTKRLLESASKNEAVAVAIDGPFGPQLQYQDYPVLALFGTGIGVTPAMTIAKDVIERRSSGIKTVTTETIYFSWAIRSSEEILPFMDMFTYWADRINKAILPINFNFTVHVTRMQEGPDYFENIPNFNIIYGGRPDISSALDKVKTLSPHQRVWVHACGPDSFTKTVVNGAVLRHFSVHNETFEF